MSTQTQMSGRYVAAVYPRHICMKADPVVLTAAATAVGVRMSNWIDPPMSPRNDVNRLVKLARGLGLLQHNNVLDSDFARKESLG